MKRPNFIAWHYNESVHELLKIWENFIVFTWQYFSIFELFKTLFSPWRRDVTAQSWRGLHPVRTLELVFENLISRIIGAVVRIFVIVFGLGISLFVLIFGLIAIFLWIGTPLFFFIFSLAYFFSEHRIISNHSLSLVPNNPINMYYLAGLFLSWIIISILAYFYDTKASLFDLELDEIMKKPIFARICGRLGMPRKRFPDEVIAGDKILDDFLKLHNLTRKDFGDIIQWEIQNKEAKNDSAKFWRWENLKKIVPVGLQWRFGYTVHLDRYAIDLSKFDATEYGKIELIGRESEYEILKLILERPDQNCALVVGNSGIGKKTLLHSLAKNVRQREELGLINMRFLLLDLGKVISDAINRGEDVENFLRQLFFEASYAGNVILVIEHLEHFLGKNQSAFHPDISVVLSEFLHIPTFQIVATSTTKEYHEMIEKHDQVTKYFEVIEMREPSEDDTIKILLSQLEKYEKKRVLFTYEALQAVVRESGKYKWEFPLPERALDLTMDALMFWEKKSDEQFVSRKTVDDYLTLKTGIQHGEIEGSEQRKLLNLEEDLHRQVIGQEEAVRQVAEALRRARSGIGNSEKPIGSFLFLGPTGVGKTETAKALAKIYFGHESKMTRLDMSEFQNPNSIDRLLGSSSLDQPGRLVTAIKDNPYSLLLLDEIEKAYPEILDIFLQILDEGYVTDAFGEKVNFRNTIIIATSNAGAALIKKMVEQNKPAEEIKQAVIDYAIENNVFRTEFLNRFDGVIFFRPLRDKELVSVVRLQLQKFARKVNKEKNIEIVFNDGVVEKIIQKGYNPIFGARSLNRYIEDEVEGMVAKKIISGEAKNGGKIDISL